MNGVWIDHVPQVQIIAGDTLWLGGAELEVVDHVLANCALGECFEAGDAEETERPKSPGPPGRELCRRLSPAEIDVLLWISRGYDDDVEIGKLLHRSSNTVHTEVSSIFKKLEIHSRSALMGWIKRSSAVQFPPHTISHGE